MANKAERKTKIPPHMNKISFKSHVPAAFAHNHTQSYTHKR